jgi:peptidoglycan hydrolase-like protein with peptidoglycan-binding domain
MSTSHTPDVADDEPIVVDTTPPGADPDTPPADEGLAAEAFADEPWPEFDPEAAPEDDDGGLVSFDGGPVALADTSTFERWLQSALKALVAPDLVVDGKPGRKTREALVRFQQRSARLGGGALTADGVVGPKTIAALERVTQSTAPKNKEGEAAPSTPTSTPTTTPTSTPVVAASSTLAVSEEPRDGVTEYVIRLDGDEVRFSYWTENYRNYKPYNVSRYRGARKGLLKDADFARAGYGPSELKILKANALKESGGAFGAINTWDDQIVSWGMAQFAGQAGTLAALLADLKEDASTRASFAKFFTANGIDVDHGAYPWKGGQTKTGAHVVVARPGDAPLRGNPAWSYIRTQPRLIGAFLLAGNDPALQLGQTTFWRRGFLLRAINKRVGQRSDGKGGNAVRRYITSERGLAILVRLHNWMPGYVVSWTNRFFAELQKEHQGRDLCDPDAWDQPLEDAFVQKVSDERKRVKTGSYDDYALDLSRARGSFDGGSAS